MDCASSFDFDLIEHGMYIHSTRRGYEVEPEGDRQLRQKERGKPTGVDAGTVGNVGTFPMMTQQSSRGTNVGLMVAMW